MTTFAALPSSSAGKTNKTPHITRRPLAPDCTAQISPAVPNLPFEQKTQSNFSLPGSLSRTKRTTSESKSPNELDEALAEILFAHIRSFNFGEVHRALLCDNNWSSDTVDENVINLLGQVLETYQVCFQKQTDAIQKLVLAKLKQIVREKGYCRQNKFCDPVTLIFLLVLDEVILDRFHEYLAVTHIAADLGLTRSELNAWVISQGGIDKIYRDAKAKRAAQHWLD